MRGISYWNSTIKSSDWLIALPFEVHAVLLILQITLQSYKKKHIPWGAENKMSKEDAY